VRWRWNITRALAVLRQNGGKRVPPALQRFRSDDLLTAVFPQSTACLEHISGDIEIPMEHPIVRQTMLDCLHEALDLESWLQLLERYEAGKMQFVACDTTEPSPFSYQLIHANVYTFLDDAPAEERRTRALSTRRALNPDDLRDLAWMDQQVVNQVVSDAAPTVRDADELHDALLVLRALPLEECSEWLSWLRELENAGRASRLKVSETLSVAFAVERWPVIRAAWPDLTPQPAFTLPERLDIPFEREDAVKSLLRGRLEICGPVSGMQLADLFQFPFHEGFHALLTLENEGFILRGRFSKEVRSPEQIVKDMNTEIADEEIEWCERRLLARIHQMTLDSLRRQIRPVDQSIYMKFLFERHLVSGSSRYKSRAGFDAIVDQLEAYEIPAISWENDILPARMEEYKSFWIDESTLSGELLWCRLSRAGGDKGSSRMSSVMPVALCLRENVPWLLEPGRPKEIPDLRSDALKVYKCLEERGALFKEEVARACRIVPAQAEELLWELAAAGLVIADGFNAIRHRLTARKHSGRRKRGQARRSSGGRWNTFPGLLGGETPEDRRQHWVELLLHRYGIIFRDLLERENCAPSWGLLVPLLRRMEARGEIRGGRFVNGVAGEQYALPGEVEKLRKLKDTSDKHFTFISAVDPLNLCGIIDDKPKITRRKGNNLCFLNGELAASYENSEIAWHLDLDNDVKMRLAQAIVLDGKTRAAAKTRVLCKSSPEQPLLFE